MISILIVDDDQNTQAILSTLLTSQNFHVLNAANGREGLEQAIRHTPNLIISDIMMPEMNGFRFCRELKQLPDLAAIPFIFYSATFIEDDDQRLALGLGANRFVIKPKDNLQFLDIVQNVLNEYQHGTLQHKTNQDSETDQILSLYEKSMGRKLEETVKRLQNQQCALALSEKHLKEAQEIALLGHWAYALQTQSMQWSDQIFRILGCAPQAFIPSLETFYRYVHTDDLQNLRAAFRRALENKMSFQKEFRLLREGGPCFAHVRTQVQCDQLGNAIYVIGTLQDITEQKLALLEQERLQNELFQVQKMESLGRLASGISHDFNNLLAVINGHLFQTQRKLEQQHPAMANLKQIEAATLRATDLIDSILSYSRCELPELIPLQMVSCLNNNLDLLKPILPEGVILRKELDTDADSFMVMADETQLQQIILNLCKNAVQAMADHGTLTLGLRVKKLHKGEFPAGSGCLPGVYIELFCHDNGCGISSETLGKIFDPFFTTKKSGTGMGLAVIHNLVHAHHGFITVQSEPGAGTTFHVYFPRYIQEDEA